MLLLFLVGVFIVVFVVTTPRSYTFPPQGKILNILDRLIQPVMETFFFGKKSHAWHWISYHKPVHHSHYRSVYVRGDPNAPNINGMWSQIKAEANGQGRAIFLDRKTATGFYSFPYWRLGFRNIRTGETKICAIKIPIVRSDDGSCIVHMGVHCYVWGDDLIFFGLDPKGNQIPIAEYPHLAVSAKELKRSKIPLV